MVSSYTDIPYYMHSSYETILLQRFEIWDFIDLEGYKHPVSNSTRKNGQFL